MSNAFYNVSGAPTTSSFGASATVRAEFAAIAAGFDKLPATLTANAIVVVNSGGTALTSTTTPNLGTPSAGVLTNCTGLPVGSVTGLGTNVAAFLATPSSANLAAAVTGETGSGALVFATSPTLVTPVLGAATATTLGTSGNVTVGNSLIVTNTAAFAAFVGIGGVAASGTEYLRIAGNGADAILLDNGNIRMNGGNLLCLNGSVTSGNEVIANGFGQNVSMQGLQMLITAGGGAANYDIVARINGVRLLDGDSAWTALSSLDYKTDIEPFPGDPFEIIMGHRAVIGRYKNMPKTAMRPFLLYEDAVDHFPLATRFTPAETKAQSKMVSRVQKVVNDKGAEVDEVVQEQVVEEVAIPESKGLVYENYHVLYMAAFQKQIDLNAALLARIAVLEAK